MTARSWFVILVKQAGTTRSNVWVTKGATKTKKKLRIDFLHTTGENVDKEI
jgi:uncharacterized protein YggU (UPF0235/DUF167 family)